MNTTSMRSLAALLMFLVISLRAAATDHYVWVGFFSLSPNPVHIKSGDVVYWVENDDLGPYLITGGWGSVVTPYGIQFGVGPGVYNYTAESGWGGGRWNGTVIVDPNYAPTVIITNPTNNAVLAAPASFSFEADAEDANPDDISDVEFFVGNTLVNDVFTPPYATAVADLPAGTYNLKVIAWDKSFARATNTITVTVITPGPIAMGGCSLSGGKFLFQATGLFPGTTNILQCSTNMVDWVSVQTDVCSGTSLSYTNTPAGPSQFYRIMQLQ